jgi:hypothetical protein
MDGATVFRMLYTAHLEVVRINPGVCSIDVRVSRSDQGLGILALEGSMSVSKSLTQLVVLTTLGTGVIGVVVSDSPARRRDSLASP